jgi:hypothetical protein
VLRQGAKCQSWLMYASMGRTSPERATNQGMNSFFFDANHIARRCVDGYDLDPVWCGSSGHGVPASRFERVHQLWLHPGVNRSMSQPSSGTPQRVYELHRSGPSVPKHQSDVDASLSSHTSTVGWTRFVLFNLCSSQAVVSNRAVSFLSVPAESRMALLNARVSGQSQSRARKKKLKPVQPYSQIHIRTIAVYNAQAHPHVTPSRDARLQSRYPS